MTNDRDVLLKENSVKKSSLSAFISSVSACFTSFAGFFESYPLHNACKQGDVNKLTTLLSQSKDKVQINLLDDLGNTALFYAVNKRYYECTELLLRSGANPNQPSAAIKSAGMSLIEYTLKTNRDEFVLLLDQFIAAKNLPNNLTPVDKNKLDQLKQSASASVQIQRSI